MLRNRQLTGGLSMFFAQFMIQAGAFFAVPLFLSVVLGLNALQTGVRLVPLSIALLMAAIGIPKVWPKANPRRVVRIGLLLLIVGIGFLVAGMDPDADATVLNIPMVLMGLGLGALASQLGAVTVSAVSDKETAEVGGLQNTATNLGASMGTALIGSVLIATLSTVALTGVADSPEIQRRGQDADLHRAGRRGAVHLRRAADDRAGGRRGDQADADAIAEINANARLEALQVAFALVGLVAIGALFITARIPTVPPGRTTVTGAGSERRPPQRSGGPSRRPAGLGEPQPAPRASGGADGGPIRPVALVDRDAGRAGQHRPQLQLRDLRQVVGQGGEPQRQVDQRFPRRPPGCPGSRSAAAPRGAPRSGRRRRRRSAAPPGRRGRRAVRWPPRRSRTRPAPRTTGRR